MKSCRKFAVGSTGGLEGGPTGEWRERTDHGLSAELEVVCLGLSECRFLAWSRAWFRRWEFESKRQL